MAIAQAFRPPRSLTGIGISLAVHLLLIGAWQLSRPVALQDEDREPRRVQLLRLLPALAPVPDRADSAPHSPARARPMRPRAVAPAQAPTTTLQAAQTPEVLPTPSAADLLREARAAVGAIDRDLRKENPGRGIKAPLETAQMKLAKGIGRAADLAPNRWYQAPKVQEILDPGGYGRRRYRVVGAGGTYCVTYESNHAPDGIDSMQRGIKPKITSCPPHEEAATSQEWE